jgi:hypothetical protein
MEAAPVARGWFTGDYIGLAAEVLAPQDESGDERRDNNNQDAELTGGFVSQFVMTNCRSGRCAAQGSPDGRPVGPDSADTFSSRH